MKVFVSKQAMGLPSDHKAIDFDIFVRDEGRIYLYSYFNFSKLPGSLLIIQPQFHPLIINRM